jgi:hypothetical protein
MHVKRCLLLSPVLLAALAFGATEASAVSTGHESTTVVVAPDCHKNSDCRKGYREGFSAGAQECRRSDHSRRRGGGTQARGFGMYRVGFGMGFSDGKFSC